MRLVGVVVGGGGVVVGKVGHGRWAIRDTRINIDGRYHREFDDTMAWEEGNVVAALVRKKRSGWFLWMRCMTGL